MLALIASFTLTEIEVIRSLLFLLSHEGNLLIMIDYCNLGKDFNLRD